MPEQVELVLDAQAELGEGPVWDHRSNVLLWIDIYRARLHRFDPATGAGECVRMPGPIGAVALRRRGGHIVALVDGVWTLDFATAVAEPLVRLSAWRSSVRFNDGKCDRHGRFWSGTLDLPDGAQNSGDPSVFEPSGALYVLDAALRLREQVSGVAVSNGLDWNPAGDRMYYVDSAVHRIDCFDFEDAGGTLSARRPFAVLAEGDTADGLTVDAEGGVWVAMHRGRTSRLVRFDSDGVVDEQVDFPVPGITSCAFGGPGLDHLYVTTRRTGVDRRDLVELAGLGGIYCFRPGVRGMPANLFAA